MSYSCSQHLNESAPLERSWMGRLWMCGGNRLSGLLACYWPSTVQPVTHIRPDAPWNAVAHGPAKWSSLFSQWRGGIFVYVVSGSRVSYPPLLLSSLPRLHLPLPPPILKCRSLGSEHKGVLVFILFVCSGPVSLSHKAGQIREGCSALNRTRGGPLRRTGGGHLFPSVVPTG